MFVKGTSFWGCHHQKVQSYFSWKMADKRSDADTVKSHLIVTLGCNSVVPFDMVEDTHLYIFIFIHTQQPVVEIFLGLSLITHTHKPLSVALQVDSNVFVGRQRETNSHHQWVSTINSEITWRLESTEFCGEKKTMDPRHHKKVPKNNTGIIQKKFHSSSLVLNAFDCTFIRVTTIYASATHIKLRLCVQISFCLTKTFQWQKLYY